MNMDEKLFDLSFLEQMDDTSFVVEIITLYLHDTGIDLLDMKQTLKDGNIDAVSKTAHKLKSSTGMIQANALFAILQNIETIANAGSDIPRLNELVQEAGEQFDQLRAPLQLHLQQLQSVA